MILSGAFILLCLLLPTTSVVTLNKKVLEEIDFPSYEILTTESDKISLNNGIRYIMTRRSIAK